LPAREQQGYIDRNAREDGLFDRGQPLLRARNLDEQVGTFGASVELLCGDDRADGVICNDGRHLQRNPAIDPPGPIPRRPEQVRGTPEILERDIEEQILDGLARSTAAEDAGVVGRTLTDRVIEDGRV